METERGNDLNHATELWLLWGEAPGIFLSPQPHLLEGTEPGFPSWAQQRQALVTPLKSARAVRQTVLACRIPRGQLENAFLTQQSHSAPSAWMGGASHIRNSLTTPAPYAYLVGTRRDQSREILPKGQMPSCLNHLGSSFSIRRWKTPQVPDNHGAFS